MPPSSHSLYVDRNFKVDFFRAPGASSRLLFTFTEFGNRALDGLGFAGKFALSNGFDLVAIKAKVDDWYSSFPDAAFAAIETGLAAESHTWRGCFGSSMGAYATLHFAGRLRANVALAYSPQFDISQPWDGRWRKHAPAGRAFKTLQSEHVDPSCRYVIVFDPRDADGRHAQDYAAVIPPASLELLPIPYAGHPVSYYLRATGQLKSLPSAIFSAEGLGRGVLAEARARRTSHEDYFFNVAGHGMRRGKLRLARHAIEQAQLRKPWHPEVLIRAAQIDERLGNLHAAAAWAALAVTLSPRHPHFAATFARILHKGGRHAEALQQIGAALALSADHVPFAVQRDSIMAALARG